MSLINDALKKAARQRAQEDHSLPPMPGGNRGSHYAHGSPKKTQTLILIGGAAVVLVVVSVVLTGIMMNKGSPAANPAPLSAPIQTAPVTVAQASPKVIVQAPVIAVSLPQAPAAQPTPAPTAVPHPTPTQVAVVHEATPPVTSSMPIVTADAPSDGVQTLIDNYHISGVRASGSGSKALVDGHVYKVNDIVDRSLGLRLVKVEEDRLTFVDRNGMTYVKMF